MVPLRTARDVRGMHRPGWAIAHGPPPIAAVRFAPSPIRPVPVRPFGRACFGHGRQPRWGPDGRCGDVRGMRRPGWAIAHGPSPIAAVRFAPSPVRPVPVWPFGRARFGHGRQPRWGPDGRCGDVRGMRRPGWAIAHGPPPIAAVRFAPSPVRPVPVWPFGRARFGQRLRRRCQPCGIPRDVRGAARMCPGRLAMGYSPTGRCSPPSPCCRPLGGHSITR